MSGSVEVLSKQNSGLLKTKDDGEGWQTVRSRYRRGSTYNLNMSTRFNAPSAAMSLPALSMDISTPEERVKCVTPDGVENRIKKRSINGKIGKNIINEVEKITKNSGGGGGGGGGDAKRGRENLGSKMNKREEESSHSWLNVGSSNCSSETGGNSTSVIAAIFKNEAELLERRIQQFVEAQAERERVILEEEQKREEADTQRSQQLSDEEASLQRQIQELESTDIDVDTETDETDGETVLETEGDESLEILDDSSIIDDISLEDR